MKQIRAGMLSEGRSKLVYHALREDDSAACSNYLNVRYEGPAKLIDRKYRCRSKACQALFQKADEQPKANN